MTLIGKNKNKVGKWIVLLISSTFILACKPQKSAITSDSGDPRFELLMGKWYRVPGDDYTIQLYNRVEMDSAYVVLNFLNKKHLMQEHHIPKPKFDGKKNYFLIGKHLYIDAREEENIYAKYEIKKLSKEYLTLKYIGTKDITEPMLCGDGELFRIAEQNARFGSSKYALATYVYQNIDSLENYTLGDQAQMIFDVNCMGEVCNVRPYSIYDKKTAFYDEIKSILENMPQWKAGIQREKPVNFTFRKVFVLGDGKVDVVEMR